MNNRIEYAQRRLAEAERNGEDAATLRYWAGYLDALYRTDAELSAARGERERMIQLEQENAALRAENERLHKENFWLTNNAH